MPEEDEKQTVTAQSKNDKYKTWALWFFAALTAILLYYHFKVAKNFKIDITGREFLIGVAIIAFALFYFYQRTEKKGLPPADQIKLAVAEWYMLAGYGYLDFTNGEVQLISDDRALVYFPTAEKTFTYYASKGVMEERWKDVEESLIDRERSSTIRQFNRDVAKQELLRSKLEARGFVVDDK